MSTSTITEEEPRPAQIEDEEKTFLLPEETDGPEPPLPPPPPKRTQLSRKFWISSGVNATSTAAIIFVNKRIFTSPTLVHAQLSFAAFHFAITALLLYTVSRPTAGPRHLFAAKPVRPTLVLPLALAMIFNVVLPNASLAFSSIQFYQVVRVLLTPIVALLNYMLIRATIPARAAWTLVPVCAGVAIVSYFDTQPRGDGKARGTSPLGAVFAFTGVFASALYTVLIGRYHKLLECSSMQLLLNQAPVSVGVMVYVIPFVDDVTVWKGVSGGQWGLIGLSGVLACLINLTQFVIVNEAGPVSSTVVGHFKTCSIIVLGWIYSGKSVKDASLLGIVLAVGGIISYSAVMHKHTTSRK